MVSGPTYPRYRCGGRFFGRRVNCEQVPLLPAWSVAWMLDDPRRIPYLLVWRSRSDGTVQEAVRIAPYSEPGNAFVLDWTGWVEIKRFDQTRTFIRTLLRPLPRGGNFRLFVCPDCTIPRRALYGWEPGGRFTTSAQRSPWRCRVCAGLRYASEGGALLHRGRGAIARLFELMDGPLRSDRPDPWYPYVFSSPADAAAAGLIQT
jgi:hypothetical protein